jgi:probable aminopeptidase NPEPL1
VKHAGILNRLRHLDAIGNNRKARIGAGKATGDLTFPLLYAPGILMKQFDSKVPDMKNNIKDRMDAQASCTGHFVENHLDKDNKGEYLHIDR